MQIRLIDFYPPIEGIDGEFNTFRVGLFYLKRLHVGERVLLTDAKERVVVGQAEVTGVSVGPLIEMISKHATMNHAVKHLAKGHGDALFSILKKFYGPVVATPNKKTTVVHLRRIKT